MFILVVVVPFISVCITAFIIHLYTLIEIDIKSAFNLVKIDKLLVLFLRSAFMLLVLRPSAEKSDVLEEAASMRVSATF